MKRENIFISEDFTTKRVSAVKFTTGDVPIFDCSIHFGKEGNEVTMQNCNIKDTSIVKCSPDDTYDFETGALISLMKLCGREKVIKACDELYKDDNYKNALQEMTENCEKLMEENETLKKEKEQIIVAKNILYNRLKEENEKLKGDIERLDTDMIFCGGRQNGKQFTLLVDLFKKLDQKKVDAAYKEAYNTTLPVWQKEVLKQMYEIRKIEASKYSLPHVHEWYYRKPTKRDEMWNDILACDCEHSKYVKVKKEDLETFAKECNEKKIFSISGHEFHLQEYWFDDDSCIFQIFCKPAGFICAERVCYVLKDTIIDYLPPMRWDLFKKGRIVVGVRKEHYDEFKEEINRQFGIINIHKPYDDFNYSYFIFDKNANFIEVIGRSQFRQLKEINKRKVYYWEDVR